MALPAFNEFGDLPEGVYQVTYVDVISRFGSGSPQRENVTARLERIWNLAVKTGGLERLVLFGSYVTNKVDPEDVDVILVMRDEFVLAGCPEESLVLFDHAKADAEIGASIFWIRPAMLLMETLEHFIAGWQQTRDHRRRGIVEIRP